MYKHTQRSFTGGRLDAELMGRQDLAQYFKGASELKNLSVRRQGYLSKRRGTTIACDLQNLLGKTAADPSVQHQIGKIRLIPFTKDRTDGHYLILSNRRAFLAGRNGIRLVDGSWSRTIPDSFQYTPEGETDPVTKTYTDEEDYCPDPAEVDPEPEPTTLPFVVNHRGYSTLTEAFAALRPGLSVKLNGQAEHAKGFSTTYTYAVGDFCRHENKYYRCISAISTAAPWNASKWQEVAVKEMFLTETATITLSGGMEYVLDLNGYRLNHSNLNTTAYSIITLNGTYETTLSIVNSGDKTFIGTDASVQDCDLRHYVARAASVIALTKGNLKLHGGAITLVGNTTNGAVSATAANNTIRVLSGRIISLGTGPAIYMSTGSICKISGGRVEAQSAAAITCGVANTAACTFEMSGGLLINSSSSTAPLNCAATPSVLISGGWIECANTTQHNNACVNFTGSSSKYAIILGGIFVNRSATLTLASSSAPCILAGNYFKVYGANAYLNAMAYQWLNENNDYAVGDIVRHDELIWRCTAAYSGTDAAQAADWTAYFNSKFTRQPYILANIFRGANTVRDIEYCQWDVETGSWAAEESIATYDSTSTYAEYSVVKYRRSGSHGFRHTDFYVCRQAVLEPEPFDDSKWQKISDHGSVSLFHNPDYGYAVGEYAYNVAYAGEDCRCITAESAGESDSVYGPKWVQVCLGAKMMADAEELAREEERRPGDYAADTPQTEETEEAAGSETEATEESPIPPEQDKRPYYVNIPYADDELSALDYTQSGDTIFFAHRSHPPSSIRRDLGDTLAYKVLDFSTRRWKRPRIVSVSSSGTGGSGATKLVYYVCTYVKDGIESEPSLPFGFSYNLPWPNTMKAVITCDRGENAVEPDYYNIYKKEYTEYGLIATVGTPYRTYVETSLSSGSLVPTVLVDYANSGYYITSISQALNNIPTWMDVVDAYTDSAYFAGGVNCGTNGAVFDFGKAAGQIFTGLEIRPDALNAYRYTPYNPYNYWYAYGYYFSGTYFVASMTCKNKSTGVISVFTDVVQIAAPASAPNAAVNTQNKVGSNILNASDMAAAKGLERRLSFDFSDQLKTAYGEDALTKADPVFSVLSVNVKAYADESAYSADTPCNFYFSGVEFRSAYGHTKVFEDTYITPDLTITPPDIGSAFDTKGDYPACVGIHQQRLVYASSENDPFTIWLSAVGDLYNFSVHSSIREDDALTLTLGATEFPDVNHIIVNRDLMALSDGGEWSIAPVSGNALTYKTASAKMQSAIGCAKGLKPIAVNDEIVFVQQNGETLLATRYNFGSDGYESQDLSVLSQWIFKNNPIVQLCYRQNPDSVIVCALKDGTLADLVYMREHEVVAWNRAILAQGWKARGVACSKAISNGSSEVMILVEKNGAYALWRVRDDIPVRASSGLAALDHVCLDAIREVSSSYAPADGEYKFTDGATENPTYYAGLVFEAELVTVRPEIPNAQNTIQFELKNAKDAEIRILDSGDFTVRGFSVPESLASQVDTGAAISAATGEITLVSRDVKETLSGDNTGDGRISIKSSTPFPLNLLSISVDYEIQPLSGSAG